LMHGIAGFGVGVLYNILKLRIVGDSR
jgi:hypothetical protein